LRRSTYFVGRLISNIMLAKIVINIIASTVQRSADEATASFSSLDGAAPRPPGPQAALR